MNKIINRKTVSVTGCLLFLCLLFFLPPPGQAAAEPVSRITAAKGNGFMGLADRWSNKYIRKVNTQKYKNQNEVVGYYTKNWSNDNQSQYSLQNNAEKITGVAMFSYQLNSSGQLIGEIPGKALQTAWDNNIETLALVHNMSSDEFSGTLIHPVLANPKLRSETVSNIYKTLIRNGLDGVNIDFENVPANDRQALNDFMAELRRKLEPERLKVTISVPAKTWDYPWANWGGAYDYKRLAEYCDRIMLMTYDQHYLKGPPGPVAANPWVEEIIIYAMTVVPKEKLLLGIGNYGYDWIVNGSGYRSVSAANALSTARKYGVSIEWDNYHQTPYFYYWNNSKKHVVWFESTQSAASKLDLVNKYGLRGIAVWRLGLESQDFWNMVYEKLNR